MVRREHGWASSVHFEEISLVFPSQWKERKEVRGIRIYLVDSLVTSAMGYG